MKHIVTLSLVFFSLTHLAKAERVEGMKIVAERYCSKVQSDKQLIPGAQQTKEDQNPFLLSYSALTRIGILPEIQLPAYQFSNSIIADLTIRKKPKNNSP